MILSLKNKKSLIILAVIGIFCLIFIDNTFFKQSVIAYKANVNNYAKGVTVTGTIMAFNQPFLASSTTALITKIYIKEGAYVKKGQPLALLDDSGAIADVKNAQAQLSEAKEVLDDFVTGSRIQDIQIEKEKIKEINLKINTEKQNFQRKNLEYQNQSSRVKRLEKLYKAGAVSFREYEGATYIQLENQEDIDISKGKIEELKSQIIQTQANVSKLEEGFKKQQVEAKRALVKSKEAELESKLSDLDDFTIKAPYDGYISDVILREGEVASPINPVFKFVTDKNLYFKALVEENNIDSVFKGQESLIVLDAYPLRVFRGKVYEILKEVNPQSGTFIAKVSLPKKHLGKFFSGMTGDITFVTRPKGCIIIPASFVFDDDNQQYVFKKKNSRAIKTYISANYFTDFAIIDRGLKKGDIIVKPLKKQKLENNKRVKVKKMIKRLEGDSDE